MKIRIKGNSIRIRLSKPEVSDVSAGIGLTERTFFGNTHFTYRLLPTETGDKLSADFVNGVITMYVPKTFLSGWPTNQVVGFESHVQSENAHLLHLLLEKDFKCLDKTNEDQSDYYENPEKTC